MRLRSLGWVALAWWMVGCGEDGATAPPPDATPASDAAPAPPDAASPADAAPPPPDSSVAADAQPGSPDAGPGVDAAAEPDAATDAGTDPLPPPPPPSETIEPVPGEVTILQLQLPAGLVPPQLGEAAVLVGPDGTLVLLDVGNSRHDDDVRDLVRDLNTRWITPARGFPRARRPLEVDWIVVSHFHSDHIGALEPLLDTTEPLELTGGLVHRGLYDVGAGATEGDYRALCDLVGGPLAGLEVSLCEGPSTAPCVVGAEPHPAASCAGLLRGDLADAADDGAGAPSFLELGAGARLTFVGADGFVSDGRVVQAVAPFGHADSNEENARSVVSIVSHGAFRYHWGGDLTGSGAPGEPDVESFLAGVARDAFYGPLGMDVVHGHHHMRRTSSNATFVDLCAPSDGRSRNVIGGINEAYVRSPYAEVLAAWGDAGRLVDGRIWVTTVAAGGATHAAMIDAGAAVAVQTWHGGAGYFVQASRETPEARTYLSVR